jgi:hypothetical protein
MCRSSLVESIDLLEASPCARLCEIAGRSPDGHGSGEFDDGVNSVSTVWLSFCRSVRVYAV